ncbi:MAG: septal ring lytic transglycosylase RlpA family protein [Pseudomonadota bacterium]|jgi:rare lipoprotein A
MADCGLAGRVARLAVILVAGASVAACVTPRYASRPDGAYPPSSVPPSGGSYKVGKPYQVGGVWYVPREQPDYDARGIASWYGDAFHLKATANGEVFDMNAISAAHTTLPLPSMVEVTNLDNGRKLLVRVNDRGPFHDNRIIDLSKAAARELGFDRAGLANVRVRYVGPAPLLGPRAGVRYASAAGPLPTRMAPAAAAALPVPPPPPPPVESYAAPPRDDVTVQDLPPVTGREISAAPLYDPAAASALRVQAGAFSSEATARDAVARLSPAGAASIETVHRDGYLLYRVVLPAPADEAAAYALRDRVAGYGFTDARVVRTF